MPGLSDLIRTKGILNMKVLFLTEAGSNCGFGHLTRCGALYDVFAEKNISVEMIINTNEDISKIIGNRNYRAMGWIEKIKNIYNLFRDVDVVVVDSYLADRALCEQLSLEAKTVVYFDDYKRIDYPKGIVVNPSVNGDSMVYPQNEGMRYLLGKDYVIIRKEFREATKNIKCEGSKDVHKVLVTLGGINNHSFLDEITEHVRKKTKGVVDAVDVRQGVVAAKAMAERMLSSDVCISAGGQTTYELAYLGVPTIGICLADNQLSNLKGLDEEGFLKYIGRFDEKNIFKKIDFALNELSSSSERKRRTAIGRRLIDGLGVYRLADKITQSVYI